MALDVGLKNTGIAVTDPAKIIATGLATVDTASLISFIKNYQKTEPIELFVVGESKNLNGTPMQATPIIEAFVLELQKSFPNIPIEREDERFTSKMAFRTIIEVGIKKQERKQKKLVDKVAAVIILQSYMSRKNL